MKLSVNAAVKFLWAAALLSLPVTSFRYFPFLGDKTYVRPLALYPLALLMPLLFIQLVRKKIRNPWPGALILLGVFAAAVLTVSSFGVLIDPIPLRGQTYLGRNIRALITLAVGIVFFVAGVWMNRDEDDLRFTVKWIFAGLGLNILWSGVQAITFYTPLLEKEMVTHWQLAFSVRELVRTNRISGMAYEPSWLAGQLATMYLPWLVAALLTGTRLTRWKWLEPVILTVTFGLLIATYSRGGILIAFGTTGLVVLLIGRAWLKRIWNWFRFGFRGKFFGLLLRLGLIASVLAIAAGTFTFLGQKNYFRRLWEIDADSLNEYIVDINAGARGAYATGALGAFEEYPLTGVGLGASGFYIYDNLPDWSLTTVPEIARQLDPRSRLYPNPKNMYVRLLAETGVLGFVLFMIFQFAVLGDALTHLQKDGWRRFLGVAALFAWLAIALYNFTQDSLANPNLWLIPGILVGMTGSLEETV
ncbi:MAG: hypothetical protein Kow002_03900 [Anaerolineales bacterium]